MPSNIVTAGLGLNLVTSGLAGTPLIPGTAESIQNPSFETPGSNPGDAANWTSNVLASIEEYATFSRPGQSLVADVIPVEQPTLGFTILHQQDGTIIVYQAANTDTAQEDFEQAWSSNEDYMLAFVDLAGDSANFKGEKFDGFEFGWGDDSGLLNNFDGIVTINAFFNTLTLSSEAFGPGWPTGYDGAFISQIPNIFLGKWTNATSTYEDGSALSDTNQYCNCILANVLEDSVGSPRFNISYVGQGNIPTTLEVDASGFKKGDIVVLIGTSSTGVVDISNITLVNSGTATISFEGEPGFYLRPDGFTRTEFDRAFF